MNRFNLVPVNRFRTNPNRFTVMLMNRFSTKLNRFSRVRMNRFIIGMNRFNQSVPVFSWQTTYMHYSLHISQLGDYLLIFVDILSGFLNTFGQFFASKLIGVLFSINFSVIWVFLFKMCFTKVNEFLNQKSFYNMFSSSN